MIKFLDNLMHMKQAFYFWVHLFIILLIWSSIFWLNWKIIFIFVLLYYLQLLIFGNCILTIKQFNSKKRSKSFYAFTLKKLGFNVNEKTIANFVDFVTPWIILFLAIVWQVLK